MPAYAYSQDDIPPARPQPPSPRAGLDPDYAEWASRRPAPRGKDNAQIRAALEVVMRLARCGDRRLEALGKGAYFAVRWTEGRHPLGPATGIERPDPNFLEVGKEIEAAGRAAAGVQAFPNASWCDEGRIAARGVEEWLTWVYMPAYPIPPWLEATLGPDEVTERVLGLVGLGRPGLLGPGVSPERFPYDVADIVDVLAREQR